MNDYQKTIFKERNAILENVDKLIEHGKIFQKNKSSGQLSLFGTEDVNVSRFNIEYNDLSQLKLEALSQKEEDLIGLPLTYNKFDKYLPLEAVLTNSSIEDVFYATEEGKSFVFIARVSKIVHAKTKAGKPFGIVFAERNKYEVKLMLFGDEYINNINGVFTNQIYIIRAIYNRGGLIVKKIQNINELEADRYIEGICIDIGDVNRMRDVRNYCWASMRNKGDYNFKFRFNDEDYPIDYKVSISSVDISTLEKFGCKVLITKKR